MRPRDFLERLLAPQELFEFAQKPPSSATIASWLRKRDVWWQALILDAEKRKVRSPEEPPYLCALCAGDPVEGRRRQWLRPWRGRPGCWVGPPDATFRLVVISALPETRATMLVRTMGAGTTRERALRELEALPPDAPDRTISARMVVRLHLELTEHPDPEVRRTQMETQKLYDQLMQRQLERGIERGIERGAVGALRETVVQVSEARGLTLSTAQRAKVAAGRAALVEAVERTSMTRSFNTVGPCKAGLHYMLATERRRAELHAVIDGKSYFALHGPPRSGKTTALLALAEALTEEGRYAAVVLSLRRGADFGDDLDAGERSLLRDWRACVRESLPEGLWPPPWPDAPPGARVGAALNAWSLVCLRPLVVLLDDLDALPDGVRTSVLGQIRAGHPQRPRAFPSALAVAGLHKRIARGDGRPLTVPFNIVGASFAMRDFTAAEVAELYAQHTAETGQRFEEAAVATAFELTQGQPWLVNALARHATEEIVRDRAQTVTVADVMAARDRLIEQEETHLDSLAERLREPRVRAIIDPTLSGGELPALPPDDVRFVKDLGLVRETEEGALEVANPIYREIIGRSLALSLRVSMPRVAATWIAVDGGLDVEALLGAWVSFWTEHGETLQAKSPYSEAAAHLVLLAFLHRVVNGGGRIEREYAAGTGRMDVRVEFKGVVLGIEVKTWRDSDKKGDPAGEGVAQLERYMARVGAEKGWLVVFDQRKDAKELPERVREERVTGASGREVAVMWG